MAPRLELHALLLGLSGGHAYFQPPPSVEMSYPCIVYRRESIDTAFADNRPYKNKKRYQLTIIDRDPDSEIVDMVKELPMCSYVRFFVTENLNHDVFDLYF